MLIFKGSRIRKFTPETIKKHPKTWKNVTWNRLVFYHDKNKDLGNILGAKMIPKNTKMWPENLSIIEGSLFFLHFSRFRGANSISLDLEWFWEGFGTVWGWFWKDFGKVWGSFDELWGGFSTTRRLPNCTLLVFAAPIFKVHFTCFRGANFRFRCFLVFVAQLFLFAVFSFRILQKIK